MIQVLVLDIDGVLTDGKVTLDDSGRELKTLYAHDSWDRSRWDGSMYDGLS